MAGFVVIHGNRMEDLRDLLVARIAAAPADPFDIETFLVPGPGIAQWLRLALAQQLGIAAGTRFLLPDAFLREVARALGLLDTPGQRSAELTGATLAWRLMKLLPELPDDVAQPVLDYLADDADGTRRWQLAGRLQGCFERYQQYRPDWLALWERNRPVFELAGERPAATAAWQAELWRMVLRDAGDLGPDLRIDALMQKLEETAAAGGKVAGLPQRLFVVGFSTLPPKQLEALARLGEFMDVMLFVMNPSRYYWGDIVETGEAEKQALRRGRQPRREDAPVEDDATLWHEYGHPLLASWGKQGRDFIALLHSFDAPERYTGDRGEIDLFRDFTPATGAPSLLQCFQQRVLELDETPPVSAETRSIRFVEAYGPMREVEVLRDHLLAALDEIEGLQPADIIVLCPDVERYAPLIEAAFGSIEPSDASFVAFSIADVTPRGREPYLRALEMLLALPESRVTASDVLDLLEVPAFRRQFDIGEDDLPRIQAWLAESGVRWGIDAAHRETLGLRASHLNTWRHGLDRMLLGYAVGEGIDGAPWEAVAPFGDIGGVEAAVAGRLDACLERLDHWRLRLQSPRSPAVWVQDIRALMAELLSEQAPEAARSKGVIDNALADWQQQLDGAGFDQPLALAVVREVIFAQLETQHASQRFMGGAVNFCGFLPMRAVPFRVVAMLGMNDGAFPRQQNAADFDLLEAHWRPGDRSRRVDDRYLFMEALLAARDRLVITWTARSAASDSRLPSSVLVAQLRDHLDRDDRMNVAQLTETHPLHPFSARYFEPLDPEHPLPATYAGEWQHERSEPRAVPAELPEEDLAALLSETALTLADLMRFMKRPTSVFFDARLRVRLAVEAAEIADDESWGLDGLQAYALREQLFDAARQGVDAAALEHRQRLEGHLPAGPLATLTLEQARPRADALHEHWAQALLRTGHGESEPVWRAEIDLALELHEGLNESVLHLQDWLVDVRGSREQPWLLNLRIGKLAPLKGTSATAMTKEGKHWIDAWLRHLAACAMGLSVSSLLVGEDCILMLEPMGEAHARERLTELAQLWLRARTRPLATQQDVGMVYLQALAEPKPATPGEAERAALSMYEGADGVVERERTLARLYTRFEDLLDAGFVAASCALYEPLLDDVEALGSRMDIDGGTST